MATRQDYSDQLQQMLLRFRIAPGDHEKLASIFASLDNGQLADLVTLLTEKPELIYDLTVNLIKKRVILASKDAMQWDKIIAGEEKQLEMLRGAGVSG